MKLTDFCSALARTGSCRTARDPFSEFQESLYSLRSRACVKRNGFIPEAHHCFRCWRIQEVEVDQVIDAQLLQCQHLIH